jgi:ATP-dependent Clp protease ATP-binding subunit ClpC
MTSNAGASSIKRQTSLGFGAMSEEDADFEGMKEKILEASKKEFKPEFLNRLDDMVVFKMLEKDSLSSIVDLEVKKLLVRLKEKDIELELEASARDFLIKEGYDPNFGARPMRRAVERHLEDSLAESLLRGEIKAGDLVTVRHDGESKQLSFESNPTPTTPEPDEAEVTG